MPSSRRTTSILFASLVIVMLGFGIAMPLMPFYIEHFGASGGALGFMMALYSFMMFIFAPIWGRVSDQVGRKPVLLVGLVGFALSFVLQGFAQDLWQFILARGLAGILSAATLPAAMATIADTTAPENRAAGMGQMGAAMGLGMIFGPMMGGLLTRVQVAVPEALAGLFQVTTDAATGALINLTIPFLGSALLAFIALPLAAFFLPESHKVQHSQAGWQGLVKAALRTPPAPAGSGLIPALRGPLRFLMIMSFLLAFALANLEGVMGLFAKDQFSLGPDAVGLLMGAMGILSVIQQGLLMGPLTRRFGEQRILLGGLVLSSAAMLGLALASSLWLMVALALVFNIGNSLLRPSVTALVSRQARMGQGQAMGLANAFQALGRTAGPLWAGAAYDLHATLPFWTGALIQAAALAFALRKMPNLQE